LSVRGHQLGRNQSRDLGARYLRLRPDVAGGGHVCAQRRRRHLAAQHPERKRAMSTPALEVKGVARNFGGVVDLRDVNFSVREGEVMGLIGPNGAGKSTLFEIISGNIRPTAGRVSYFGNDCTSMASHLRRRAGMCRTFQKVRLFESMTVRQNITVAASQCVRDRSVEEEVAAILAQMRLEQQAERRPSELNLADPKTVAIPPPT